jgi:uncharacterized RDD family membrane protein YckC
MYNTWNADHFTRVINLQREQGESTHELAGAGVRFIAGAIDGVIKLPIQVFAGAGAYYALKHQPLPVIVAAVVACVGAVSIAFHIICEALLDGQSPGKNACGIRAIGMDGNRLTVRQALIRGIWRIYDFLPCLYLLGGARILKSGMSQRMGDAVAGTTVMYDDPLRRLLTDAYVPESVYSTSEDGYLLESFLSRSAYLRAEVQIPLAKQLASYFYKNYPPVEADLISLYSRQDYSAYLKKLYYSEQERLADASAGANPN